MTTSRIFVRTKKGVSHATIYYDKEYIQEIYNLLLGAALKDAEDLEYIGTDPTFIYNGKHTYKISEKDTSKTDYSDLHWDGETLYSYKYKLYNRDDFLKTLYSLAYESNHNIISNSHNFKQLFDFIPKTSLQRQMYFSVLYNMKISPLGTAKNEYNEILQQILERKRELTAYEAFCDKKIKEKDQPNYKLNRKDKKYWTKKIIEKIPKEPALSDFKNPIFDYSVNNTDCT